MRRVHRRTTARSQGWLACAPWVILVLAPALAEVAERIRPRLDQTVLAGSLVVFFLVLLTRMATLAVAQPERRRHLLLLMCSVAVWAAGSAVLNTSGNPDLTHFPAPGEPLFLLGYAGIAAFVVVDAAGRRHEAGATWLETAVICGGAACLTGVVLVTPLASRLGSDGLPLLLSLLYPLIDVTLAVLVVAQVALGTRALRRNSVALLLGFLCFAVADSGFLAHLSAGTYDYSKVSIVLWGSGFALIVASACRRTQVAPAAVRRDGLTALVVVAGMAAALVLALEPGGTIRSYLLAPALCTLAAAGARLAMALRTANRASEAIRLSRSDDLTDLPNRRALLQNLDARCRSEAPTSLVLLDLDGFKDINDTLGHAAGDRVLVEIGIRMRRALGAESMLARLGGDEFAVVVPHDDQLALMDVAGDVLRAIRTPISIDGIALSVDASAGLTVREPADRHSSELLRRADVAMYDAKHKRAGALLYDVQSDIFSRQRLQLGDELRRAIAEHRLAVWYQPQIDASTGRICGLEALIRWNHPAEGVLSPAYFLPVARRAGLMQTLSDELARLVVADARRWKQLNLAPRIALNCAPPELMSGLFVTRLSELLDEAGVPAAQFTIEVTEDSFLAEPERARQVLHDIRALGFDLSIDDYGTGFSSLSYLRDLEVQELKIDRSFVDAMIGDSRSRMIIASTLQMAGALELRTVAEGVEDAATTAALVALGVDVLQGFHLGRPIPAHEVVEHLRRATALIP